jgi:hypothetical protein
VSRLERWQPEGVAAVLDPEDAQEEGVHAENDSTPNEDRDLLLAGIGHSRDLESKTDGGKGEDAVCEYWSVRWCCGSQVGANLHIAATICVSRPNWFWKPPAK